MPKRPTTSLIPPGTPAKQKRLCYPRENVALALREVREGGRIGEVARKYGVPQSTIRARHLGLYADKKPGPATVLTPEEEGRIVDWIYAASRRGFCVTKTQLLESVRSTCLATKRKNPFANNMPGRSWYESFLKRHPRVYEQISENYSASRLKLSEDGLCKWFEDLPGYLSKEKVSSIEPDRIFNCAETKLPLNPKAPAVLLSKVKNDKNEGNAARYWEKDNVSVLVTCNANGNLAPPLVLFTGKDLPNNVMALAPEDFVFGFSENGLILAENFYEYISNSFEPWLAKNNIELPVILYIDSHSPYLTVHLDEFCSEHKIVLVPLYTNALHIIQPLDVGLFEILKSQWLEMCEEFCESCLITALHEYQTAPLLKRILDSIDLEELLRDGFKKCGLYPFDVNAIDFMKIKNKPQRLSLAIDELRDAKSGNEETKSNGTLEDFEKFLTKDQIKSFKLNPGPMWKGETKNEGLFNIWYKLLHPCKDFSNDLQLNDQGTNIIQLVKTEEIKNDNECQFSSLNTFLLFHT